MHRRLLSLLAVLATTNAAGPAAQEQPKASIRTTVRQVLVAVVVTDKASHYITNLRATDFAVYEDDVPQKIVAFDRTAVAASELDSTTVASKPNSSVAVARPQTPVRTYLICIDTLHSSFDNFARVRKALKNFFAGEEPGDAQYALVALGLQVHMLIDSTNDPGVVLKAIDSKALLKTIRDSEAANTAIETQRFAEIASQWCGSCTCTSQQMDMANIGCPNLKGQVRAALMSLSQRTAIVNSNFLADLTRLVYAMATMPTKRTVLFVSDGFNRYAGEEYTAILRALSVNDPNMAFNPRDLQPEIDKLLRLAERDDVRFYTLDSRGLYSYSAVPGAGEDASSRGVSPQIRHAEVSVAWQNSDALAELAKQTGGQFFENNNDLLRGIRQAFADGREEYVLAYVPSGVADGKFHRIRVAVDVKDAGVRTKQGYWATP